MLSSSGVNVLSELPYVLLSFTSVSLTGLLLMGGGNPLPNQQNLYQDIRCAFLRHLRIVLRLSLYQGDFQSTLAEIDGIMTLGH